MRCTYPYRSHFGSRYHTRADAVTQAFFKCARGSIPTARSFQALALVEFMKSWACRCRCNLKRLPLRCTSEFLQFQKASSTLRSSRAVPHPSTNRALRRLTSEFGRDPVHSTRYGRWRPLYHVVLKYHVIMGEKQMAPFT